LFSYLREGKIRFHHFWPSLENSYGLRLEKSAIGSPGKNLSDVRGFKPQSGIVSDDVKLKQALTKRGLKEGLVFHVQHVHRIRNYQIFHPRQILV